MNGIQELVNEVPKTPSQAGNFIYSLFLLGMLGSFLVYLADESVRPEQKEEWWFMDDE